MTELGIDVVLAVGELARGYGGESGRRRGRGGANARPELVQPGDVVLVKGSRAVGLEVVAEALAGVDRLVERVLAAGIFAMAISILAGPKFIDFLRRKELGQHIREEGPPSTTVEAGHADDGRPPDRALDVDPVPRALEVHAGRADRLLRHARLRRRSASSTTSSRSRTAARSGSPAAGSSCCSPRSRSASAGRTRHRALDTTSTCRSSTGASRSRSASTCSSSSSSPAPRTA